MSFSSFLLAVSSSNLKEPLTSVDLKSRAVEKPFDKKAIKSCTLEGVSSFVDVSSWSRHGVAIEEFGRRWVKIEFGWDWAR